MAALVRYTLLFFIWLWSVIFGPWRGERTASLTYYQSYPFCCPNSPNYDPTYPKDECDNYSGCEYIGDFAALGHESLAFVQTNNLVAFYDNYDPYNIFWERRYANKTIQLTKEYNGSTYVFNATIADACGNKDCNNCCAKNSRFNGYLVDMEYYTVMNNFNSTDAADGDIQFTIFD